MLAIIVLLSAHLIGGHHYQEVEDFPVAQVTGDCQSGDYCSLTEITLPALYAFGSDEYVCSANQLHYVVSENLNTDAHIQLFPFDSRHIDVYFPNETDDVIPDGTKVKFAYTCQGMK